MAGQAALKSREEVRSTINKVECNYGKKSGGSMKMGKESMKTSNNK